MTGLRNLALAAILGVAACGDGVQNDAFGLATSTVGSIFGGNNIEQLTATRASLEAAGFKQPLLVGEVTQPQQLRAGLLKSGENQGVVFWRGGDGSTVKTDNGVVRGTIGIGFDLYSAETRPTLAAIETGRQDAYPRIFRHLNPLSQLDVTRFFCELAPPAAEQIVVFDRPHNTLRYVERCVSDTPDVTGQPVEITNTYWKDPKSPIFWRSEQWISKEIGYITLERVFE